MRYKNLLIFAAIVIIFLIIIIFIVKSANNSCNKYHYYLSGMWSGDPEFLKKADLKDLQIFIAPKNKNKRNGYIIMIDANGDFILNQPIEMQELSSSHSQRWAAYNMDKKIKNDNFNVDYLITNDIEDFPKNISITVSIGNGSLIIKNNNTTYALCEKNLIASAAAIEAYSS